jgi:hypothetical protein
MANENEEQDVFDVAAERAVELGNRLSDENKEADLWDVGSGLLAGAVQFWLYTRQPCGDPKCESCSDVSTAEQRLAMLLREIRELAEDSEYFHSPHDTNVGRA